jgi:steroid 5-alpha reductase family enzyme
MVLAMAAAWQLQRFTANGGWVDVVWTFSTGATAALAALAPQAGSDEQNLRQAVVAAVVAIWSARLSFHIASRVRKSAEDARYQRLREAWGATFQSRMLRFLMAQAACSAVLIGSITVAARVPAEGLHARDLLALALAAAGVAGAAVADAQLARFKANNQNRGGILRSGLWSWSRHPNYFFEWLAWLALPALAAGVAGYPAGWLALAAPAVMYWVLMYATGVPMLEEHMLRSRDDAYRAYRQQTNAFFPFPPRKVRST